MSAFSIKDQKIKIETHRKGQLTAHREFWAFRNYLQLHKKINDSFKSYWIFSNNECIYIKSIFLANGKEEKKMNKSNRKLERLIDIDIVKVVCMHPKRMFKQYLPPDDGMALTHTPVCNSMRLHHA